MRITQHTIGGWLTAYASAAIGCSGSAADLLVNAPDAGAGDAGSVRNVPVLAPDASAQPQAAPSSQPASTAPPIVGRVDNFAPDGAGSLAAAGPLDGALAGSESDAWSVDGGLSLDAGVATTASCTVLFTVTNANVDGVLVTNVVIGGDAAALGDWDPTEALKMSPVSGTSGDWTLRAELPAGQIVAFKFGMSGTNGKSILWELGPNSSTDRTLAVTCPDGSVLSYIGEYNHIPISDGGA